MKTTMFTKKETPERWLVVDAEEKILGRLATKVARKLRGKDSPMFTPHDDVGDNVIVVNASKVAVSGTKSEYKYYHSHSGYHGGAKKVPYEVMMERAPERVIIQAVKGMLPKNRLGRALLRKLHVYAGPTHPHEAQKPESLSV